VALSKRILVVEDNDLNMKVFRHVLQAHGYECVETGDGLQAIELARTAAPNLIIMDIQLPGMSGIEVTKNLKTSEQLRHIPVIAVSAFAMRGDEERIRKCGCEDYLSKPIKISKLIETIEHHIN
jgi:two-component system cell cycle response regulator DivK